MSLAIRLTYLPKFSWAFSYYCTNSDARFSYNLTRFDSSVLLNTRGADKSLARPGKKQAQKHVRDARDFNNIETRAVIKFFTCKARSRMKFTPF